MTPDSSRRGGRRNASGIADEVLALTQALMARPSVSPDDAGCQELLIERLEGAGFAVERMRFGDVVTSTTSGPRILVVAATSRPANRA